MNKDESPILRKNMKGFWEEAKQKIGHPNLQTEQRKGSSKMKAEVKISENATEKRPKM